MRALVRSEKAVESLKFQLSEVGRVGRKAGKAAGSAFNFSGLRNYVALLTGTGGLLLALRQITKEYERHTQIQNEAASTQVQTSAATQQLLENLSTVPKADRAAAITTGRADALRAGIPVKMYMRALAAATSSTGAELKPGGLPVDLPFALESTRFLSGARAHDPESLANFAAAVTGIAKATGYRDPAANLGYLNVVQAASQIPTLSQGARALPPPILGMVKQGNTPAEAGAFMAMLTTMSQDVQGERSGTAAINFAKIMNKVLPASRVSRALGVSEEDVSLDERLLYLEQNPRTAKRIAKALPEIRAKNYAQIVAFLTDPNSQEQLNYAATHRQISGQTEAEMSVKGHDIIRDMLIDPDKPLADLQRKITATAEQIQLANKPGATGGVFRQGIVDVLRSLGETDIAEKIAKGRFELGTGLGTHKAAESFIDIIGGRAEQLEPRIEEIFGTEKTGPDSFRVTRRERQITPTATEAKLAELLRGLITTVEEFRDANAGPGGAKRLLTNVKEPNDVAE